MIKAYKILNLKIMQNVYLQLELQSDNTTGGHSLNQINTRYDYDLRKYFFSVRIVKYGIAYQLQCSVETMLTHSKTD